MKFKKIAAIFMMAAVLSVSGCGSTINKSAAAATLDGKEISMGLANFWAQCQAAQYDAYLLNSYGEGMWSSDSGDGTTMTESVKKNVMDTLQEYYLLDAHASEYKIALTDEEKAKITEAAQKFLSDNSNAAKNKMGADQSVVEEMLRLYTIHSKVHQAIVDTIDTNVTEEEMAQKTFSYVRIDSSSASSGDNSKESSESDASKSETDIETLKGLAETLLASSKESDLDKAAEEGGYTVSTCSYGTGDLSEDNNTTSMEVSVLQAADKLSDGELASGVVSTDDACYVIRMDNTNDKDAAEKKKESILDERRNTKYDEVLQGYKDNCKWTINEEQWAKVNFDELYKFPASEEETDGSTSESAEGSEAADSSDADTADGSSASGDGAASGSDAAAAQ